MTLAVTFAIGLTFSRQILINSGLNLTFLTSVLVTIATLNIIPFIIILQTKGVHTISFSVIIG